MWFHCFPSAAIMFVAMSLPHIFIYLDNKYIVGNPYRRYLGNKYDIHTYLRDMRLGGGDPYKQVGLECLPLEEEVVSKKVCDCA